MTDQPSNDQFRASSFLQGGNATYIEALHERFHKDPASVDQSWRDFFAALQEPSSPQPSWARRSWSFTPAPMRRAMRASCPASLPAPGACVPSASSAMPAMA